MLNRRVVTPVLVVSVVFAPIVACDSLPGDEEGQGAVIGGVGGAVAGAAIAKDNRLLGALIGGALGAGGGYLIGAQVEKVKDKDSEGAQAAADKAQNNPATADQARNATTADLNTDGFVTLDEVEAMEQAGLNDDEMVRRLRATGQIFELTQEHEDRLVSRGVSRYVVNEMRTINRAERDRLVREQEGVISRDPNAPGPRR